MSKFLEWPILFFFVNVNDPLNLMVSSFLFHNSPKMGMFSSTLLFSSCFSSDQIHLRGSDNLSCASFKSAETILNSVTLETELE